MSKNPIGTAVQDINFYSPFIQHSLDVTKIDNQSTSGGIQWVHWKAMPSPLGLKDRGDYRRSDGVDQITSNGMLYTCSGKFTATIVGNDSSKKWSDGAQSDPSMARLILPRFYDLEEGDSAAGRIRLAPGDRVYVASEEADVLVSNYQKIDHDPNNDDVPMYPIEEMELAPIDSRNISYKEGVDFCITKAGNIRWIAGGENPGIDPDTNRGRVYSCRFMYKSFWYVLALPKEIRMTNVTVDGVRTPTRLPYSATIVREYQFYNQNRGDIQNVLKSKEPIRAGIAPIQSVNLEKHNVIVDMSAISEE